MSVTIRLEGSEALQAALREASSDVRAAAAQAVTATAIKMRKEVVRSIQRGPASGRTYRKYSPNRVHTASAPGQPPMSDTGRLASSIEFDQIAPLTATVGSNIVYAVHLEYGTRKMAPRPFFRPAVEKMRPEFNKRLEAALAEVLR